MAALETPCMKLQADRIASSVTQGKALIGHKHRCFDCAYQKGNSGVVATASEDCTACIWRVLKGDTKLIQKLGGYNGEVMRVSWSPNSLRNGGLLVTGSADGGARIYGESSSGLVLSEKPLHVIEHGDRNEVYACFFTDGSSTPCGPMIITAAHDTLTCWDLERVLAASPESRSTSALSSSTLKVDAWKYFFSLEYQPVEGAAVFGGMERNQTSSAFIFDVAMTRSRASRPLLAAALSDGSARISEVNGAETIATLQCDGFGSLTSVTWSQDDSSLATTCSNGAVLIWDSRMWKCRTVLQGAHSKSCFGCLVHPTIANMVLSWSNDGSLACWDISSAEAEQYSVPPPLIVSSLPTHASFGAEGLSSAYPIFRCAINEQGNQMVVAGGESTKSFLGTPMWVCDF